MYFRRFILPLLFLVLLTACLTDGMTMGRNKDEAMLLKQADTALALGKRAEATGLYEQALAGNVSGVRGHLVLADIYRQDGRYDDAVKLLKQAYQTNSNSVEVLKALSESLLLSGRGAEAGVYLGKGLVQSPDDIALLNAYGIWFDQHGQHNEAQEQYAHALSKAANAKDRESTRHNLALSLIASGKAEEAIAALQKSKHPENTQARDQALALAYGVQGKTQKAKDLLKKYQTADQISQTLRFYEAYRQHELPSTALFEQGGAAK